jgi:glutamate/tyrosine decarboxylase-like PLP-dependent enzyme
MEGAGAVFAENEVLGWLAKEVGLPNTAGGVFVQGGTLGNLSALVAARHQAKAKLKEQNLPEPTKWKFICSSEAHSSLKAAAAVMDVEIIKAQADPTGHLRGDAVAAALKEAGDGVFAIVATAGTTNFGILDRLHEIGTVANENNIWFHVDGAYGLAGILAPELKHLYKGVEHADSFIVDPHKWLFAPFDACALVYREPEYARIAHTQHGEYLEVLNHDGDFNPSDYGFNLTRRVRGLPLWFSMASHGAELYRQAISANVKLTHQIAKEISTRGYLRLVRDPQLSVVVFERLGWELSDYQAWSEKLLSDQFAFVVPSSHQGKPNTRFAIVNPLTKYEDLVSILDSME